MTELGERWHPLAKVDTTQRDHQVFKPHKAGLPNLGQYFAEVWRRRDFAMEMSVTQMRAANTNTVLGELWLVLNPLLLAGVYYVLIFILAGNKNADFAQITSGLFFFYFISGSITSSAVSVTAGGKLILNQAFPKMLLPMSSVYLAFRRFLPTLIVYAVIHVIAGRPITLQLLWIPLIVALGTLFALGLGMIVATAQVYFRDTASFLPYIMRIWLYLSPVLWSAEMLFERFHHKLGEWVNLVYINPMFSVLGMWTDVLTGHSPDLRFVLVGVGVTFACLITGAWIFIAREREFAVRL